MTILTDKDITPIRMRQARLLLSSGLSRKDVCSQVFGCSETDLLMYTQEWKEPNIKAKTLKRMIEDGALLGDQPLGTYICYLLDRLDESVALIISEPSSRQHQAENIALYSARLDLVLYNNALAKSHLEDAHSEFHHDSHSQLLRCYEKSLYNSYAKNESESWINRKLDPCVGDFGLEEQENRMKGKDQYNHNVTTYALITEKLSN